MHQQPQRPAHDTYRSDIDGLRALAVVSVVLDHLHTRLTGGYVGVDVFFVISGYLISSHILKAMDTGTFSIGVFYERRIRRILPALLVMMFVVSILAYLYLIPAEIEAFALSLLAALFSVSNLLFWHQAGYFDAPSAFKPLLHTWSLGVEEQFYIFFPLFLAAVHRFFPGRMKAAIWTVTLVSFALACMVVRINPTAAFFFSPLRAWELLVGTIISQHYVPTIATKLQRNFASLIGIILIAVPCFLYNGFTRFPGFTALIPCVGAALVIAAGESGQSYVGRFLSLPPIVFVGVISYSLYLWHWPILALQDVVPAFAHLSTHEKDNKLAYLLVSFVIATLSWRFIETPFRKGSFRPGPRNLFILTGSASAVIAAMGMLMIITHGVPSGFPVEAREISAYTNYDVSAKWQQNICFFTPETDFQNFQPATCLHDDSKREQYLLVGDSHAADLYPGLSEIFPELNISEVSATFCPPLLTEPVLLPGFAANCNKLSTYIFRDYLPRHHVDTVLLAGRWEEDQIPELGRTIAWIQAHGMKVVVFGPSIEYDMPLPRILISALRYPAPGQIERHQVNATRLLDRQMANLATNTWKVPYISAYEDLCNAQATQLQGDSTSTQMPGTDCSAYAAFGVPLLFDTNHYTAEGSILLAKVIRARKQLP